MKRFKIGVLADGFRTDVRTGIKKAASLGATGVQVYATNGEMAPENMNSAQRKDFLNFVKDEGIIISALCGDLGGHGFTSKEDNPARIEKSKRIMDLAKDLECDVITTHIGVVPHDIAHDRFKIMQDACEMLGEYGDKVGASFAIETGPEKATDLKMFLDSLSNNGVKVNYDPANLVMVTGDDPVKGVYTLKDYIVHTHAKDGVQLKAGSSEAVYGALDHDNIKVHKAKFEEVPLGKGGVDWPNYLNALEEIGYKGYLTIEREVGDTPEVDIKLAIDFLNNLI